LNFVDILVKPYSIKFHKKCSSGSPFIPCRWTDDRIGCCFSHFFANTPKNMIKKYIKGDLDREENYIEVAV
jgi:hypothetical protein